MCYIKHSEISLALLRDLTITIILAKFETNLKVYIGRKYLLQVYISQRWQKYYYFTKSTPIISFRQLFVLYVNFSTANIVKLLYVCFQIDFGFYQYNHDSLVIIAMKCSKCST